jgi:hypothetical protein
LSRIVNPWTEALIFWSAIPNTVWHRPRRSERRTGRPLSRPRNVAELGLAFEVHRMLM